MFTISQNNKIAITAVAIFIVSFSVMVFFLERNYEKLEEGYANALGAHESSEETASEETNPEAKYKAYFEETSDPLFAVNSKGVFIFASEDFCNLFNTENSKFINKKLIDFINAKDHSDFLAQYTNLIQEGEKTDAVGPFRFKYGKQEKLMIFSAVPILDKKEKVIEIVFSAKDITEQAEELKETKEKTEKKTEEKTDDDDNNWMKRIYPKIDEMDDFDANKLVVDKISYAKD